MADICDYRFASLNFNSLFRVGVHHEVRHTKQIREIVEVLQK